MNLLRDCFRCISLIKRSKYFQNDKVSSNPGSLTCNSSVRAATTAPWTDLLRQTNIVSHLIEQLLPKSKICGSSPVTFTDNCIEMTKIKKERLRMTHFRKRNRPKRERSVWRGHYLTPPSIFSNLVCVISSVTRWLDCFSIFGQLQQ